MKNLILIGLILILVLPIISAEINFKQNTESDLKFPCYFNGTFCSGSAACTATITAPSGALIINGTVATNQITFHNITLNTTQTEEVGDYFTFASCTDQGLSSESTFTFRVTPFGKDLSTAQGIIYLGH